MEGLLYTVAELFLTLVLSPWFWAAIFVLLAWKILLRVYRTCKLRALERLEYTRRISADGIFVGETLELTETVKNPTWFPLFGVRMEFFMPSGVVVDGLRCEEYTKLTSPFFLPPFSKVEKVHRIEAFRRDRYRLQNVTCEYRKQEFLFEASLCFYAYPNGFGAEASLTPELYHAGNALANRKYLEDPFFHAGIRPWRGGDSLKTINFKASVRSFSGGVRQWMCNQYDSSRSYDTVILLDLTVYQNIPFSTSEQTESGLRYACFLFCEAVKNGGRVGFCANCRVEGDPYIFIPCGSGENHTKEVLERLACVPSVGGRTYSVYALLEKISREVPVTADLYLITPEVDSKTAAFLHSMEKKGRNVLTVPLTHLSKKED